MRKEALIRIYQNFTLIVLEGSLDRDIVSAFCPSRRQLLAERNRFCAVFKLTILTPAKSLARQGVLHYEEAEKPDYCNVMGDLIEHAHERKLFFNCFL